MHIPPSRSPQYAPTGSLKNATNIFYPERHATKMKRHRFIPYTYPPQIGMSHLQLPSPHIYSERARMLLITITQLLFHPTNDDRRHPSNHPSRLNIPGNHRPSSNHTATPNIDTG